MELPRIGFRPKGAVVHLAFILFSLFFIVANINLFHAPVVDFEVRTAQPGMFQVFWSGSRGSYKEVHSVFKKDLTPFQTQHVSIRLRHPVGLVFGPNVHYLRIDPLDRPGEILIKSIHLRQGGFFSIDVDGRKDFKDIKELDGISSVKIEKDGLRVVTNSADPQLELMVEGKPHYATIIPFVLGCLLLLYTLRYLSLRYGKLEYIEWFYFLVLALIITMAVVTGLKRHPDEGVHGRAAEYYSTYNHWLPPAADDPEISDTYSFHGVSRLNSGEISYLFAGKFLEFFSFMPLPSYLILRFFNISLFIILAVFCFRNPELRLLSLPLFISPQIWYVFSYFNSDAFSLFILFFIAYQVMKEGSLFNRYLKGEETFWLSFVQPIVIALFFSFLFLMKKNFYFFPVFLFLYFLLRFCKGAFSDSKGAMKRLGIIAVLLLGLFATNYTLHEAVNHWHRTKTLAKMQNATARTTFNPFENPKDTNKYMALRGKGFPLSYLWNKMNWGQITFMSTFGVYGNMSFYNTLEYYDSIRLVLYLAFICILYDLLRKRLYDGNFLLLMLVIICSTALVAASLINSWLQDFQAQGRYLLPIVPMIGIFLYSARHRLHIGRINFWGLVLFLFSSSSFIFQGLARIHKP